MPSKPYKALKPMFKRDVWRILRGDLVEIIAGKDKGEKGKVLAVIRDKRFPRVIVERKNLVSRPLSISLLLRGLAYLLPDLTTSHAPGEAPHQR
jgi:hypothetical protein